LSSGTPTHAASAAPGTGARHRLDLAREDVEARDDHHALLAIDDLQEAFRREDADVAGAKAAVGGNAALLASGWFQ
jgi:hypothetical protein